jgi:hypothetical protein
VDNLLSDREAKGDLLGLLNSGYRRGAHAYRMGGGNRDELKEFETFCAKAIAGLDNLSPALASRCLRIEMQRRSADEPIEDFFREDAHAEAEPIHEALAAWAEPAIEQLRRTRPERLGVRDRLEEALRLLVAIAEMAGARWGERGREALRELAGAGVDGAMSERVQLLTDIKSVFEDHRDSGISSASLLQGLIAIDESPWRGCWGIERDGEVIVAKGAARKLAGHLKAMKIKSKTIGPEDKRYKGYLRADFENVWKRYLDPPSKSVHSEQTPEIREKSASHIPTDDGVLNGLETPENGSTEPSVRNVRIQARGRQEDPQIEPTLATPEQEALLDRVMAEGAL